MSVLNYEQQKQHNWLAVNDNEMMQVKNKSMIVVDKRIIWVTILCIKLREEKFVRYEKDVIYWLLFINK